MQEPDEMGQRTIRILANYMINSKLVLKISLPITWMGLSHEIYADISKRQVLLTLLENSKVVSATGFIGSSLRPEQEISQNCHENVG